MNNFRYKTRVYYADTDCGGVVYHSKYLDFMERARSEYFLSKGCNVADWHNKGVVFAVSSAELKYMKPARLFDELEVSCNIIKVGKASLLIEQIISNVEDPALIYCKGMIKLACIDDKLKPSKKLKEIMAGM